jgi:photosystem II stability/assembly factor-like uncharacterized protein
MKIAFWDRVVAMMIGTILFLASTSSAQPGWTVMGDHTGMLLYGVSITSGTRGTAVGDDGEILCLSDNRSWIEDLEGWAHQQNYPMRGVAMRDESHGVIAGAFQYCLLTDDGCSSFSSFFTDDLEHFSAAGITDTIDVVAGGTHVFYVTPSTVLPLWSVFDVQHDGTDYWGVIRGVAVFHNGLVFAAVTTLDSLGTIYRNPTIASSNTWEQVFWGDNALYALDFPTDSVGYAVGEGGAIVKSVDAGLTWTESTAPTNATLHGVSFVNAQIGWAVGDSGTIIRTTDGGAHWQIQQSGTSATLRSVSFANADTGYAVGDGIILGTTTGGVRRNQPPGAFSRVFPQDQSVNFYLAPAQVTFRWTKAIDPDSDTVTYHLYVNTLDVHFSFSTTDTMVTDSLREIWLLGIPNLPTTWSVIAFDGRDSVAATNGSGSFTIVLPDAAGDEPGHLPRTYSVSNHPNPFNATTTISFDLPRAEHVLLSVFDVTGRCVARLADGIVPAGHHTIAFDGSSLASGVYFYRLDAGEFRDTRKMILLK